MIGTIEHARAKALIAGSGLGARAQRIVPHLVPGMRMRAAQDEDAADRRVSRLAGTPMLPRGMVWPTWDSSDYHRWWIEHSRGSVVDRPDRRRIWEEQVRGHEEALARNPTPLHFLGLIRMADLAPHAPLLGLPEQGVLLFFYDAQTCPAGFLPEARGGAQVIHAPESELELRETPAAVATDFVASPLSFELRYGLPEDLRE